LTNNPVEVELYSKKAIKLSAYREDYFNVACAYALVNKPTEAFEALEQAIKLGANYLEDEPWLANLRGYPQWNELMKKYFPDQSKD
jgi:hypothetical protein